MANVLLPKWKAAQNRALTPDLAGGAVNIKAVLLNVSGVGTTYTYSAAHEFLSDIPAGARTATSGNLANKTVAAADGTFDSDDPVFTGAVGDISEAIALYHDTGVATTSRIIAYFDTGVTGLPVTPNSGDINVVVNAGGWFTP